MTNDVEFLLHETFGAIVAEHALAQLAALQIEPCCNSAFAAAKLAKAHLAQYALGPAGLIH